jgi:hypothetical protein
MNALQPSTLDAGTSLRLVKVLHTIVWAMVAGCVVAIPALAWRGSLRWAVVLTTVVFAEVLVLALNRWRCPLTGVAARYTEDRSDNFDIYLPVWLARNNKSVFGSLFVAGLLVMLARWQGWLR